MADSIQQDERWGRSKDGGQYSVGWEVREEQRWRTVFSWMRGEVGEKMADSIQLDERWGRRKDGGQYSVGWRKVFSWARICTRLRSLGIDYKGTDSACLCSVVAGTITLFVVYRPARLHRLAELILWNQFLGSVNVYKFRLWMRGEGGAKMADWIQVSQAVITSRPAWGNYSRATAPYKARRQDLDRSGQKWTVATDIWTEYMNRSGDSFARTQNIEINLLACRALTSFHCLTSIKSIMVKVAFIKMDCYYLTIPIPSFFYSWLMFNYIMTTSPHSPMSTRNEIKKFVGKTLILVG
jgi:hypothetical protein